jgi:hypothetical protein
LPNNVVKIWKTLMLSVASTAMLGCSPVQAILCPEPTDALTPVKQETIDEIRSILDQSSETAS